MTLHHIHRRIARAKQRGYGGPAWLGKLAAAAAIAAVVSPKVKKTGRKPLTAEQRKRASEREHARRMALRSAA